MNPSLKVYWRPGCSSCVKVKEFLAQLGVPYESIDVAARPEAMDELRALGVKTVPVVARGRDYVFAQALEDVSRFVGKEVELERLRPQALVEKWLAVLRAAQRHVVQLPAARLHERAVDSRDRSIRDLAYHVYQVPDAFLQALENGVEDLTAVYNAPPPREVTKVAQIAAYGEAITRKIERWWAGLGDKSCRAGSPRCAGHPHPPRPLSRPRAAWPRPSRDPVDSPLGQTPEASLSPGPHRGPGPRCRTPPPAP